MKTGTLMLLALDVIKSFSSKYSPGEKDNTASVWSG